jgi:CheY-like chemotaxis protein/anti-sigma regulatory factor (Ser/Thr protein kinase)
MTATDKSTREARPPGFASKDKTCKASVLVVDDSPLDRRLAGRQVEKTGRFHVVYASNGQEALTALAKEPLCAVVTDLQMPAMDGLELTETIRGTHPRVPVILMTGLGSADIALQALQRGAASYVPKQNLARDLAGTLEQVVAAAEVDHHRRRVLSSLTRRDSHFRLENDPALIPALIELLREDLDGQLGDDTTVIRAGIALEEALLNALYHGNLEVGSELGRRDSAGYQRLAAERRQRAPYRHRYLHVFATLRDGEFVYIIRDEGRGFDTSVVPDPADPANLEKEGGRGLLLIRTFMDEVTFNQAGNQITLVKRRKAPENIP